MRRRKKHVAHASHDRWLVSYADFITLLFAFFVVMYSTAQVDKKKVGRLATAIQVAFQQLGAYPVAGLSSTVPLNEPVDTRTSVPVLALPRNQENRDLTVLRKELEQALAPEISRGEVAVRTGRDGLVISLREAGFFDSGSAGVKAGSQPAFSRMASLLGERQSNIRIEGHTDNVRIHNTQYTSNWELSTARSTEMIRLLIVKYGFAPQRLSAGGYGEYHPIASNSTEAGRALNRRVDLVVVGKHESESGANDSPVSGSPQ
jgi:chemotaxis protein MotB